jgi:hypothetical protein
MRRLIVAAALVAVTYASAIGVGVSAHYNVGMPLGNFGNAYKFSVIGFNGDIEIDFGGPVNLYTGFGYQVFKPEVGTDDLTLIPILFGIERPFPFPPITIYVGLGGSFNLLRMSSGNWEDWGFWTGGEIYYFLTPQLGVGANVAFHTIFTPPPGYSTGNTYWIHPSFGVKYWF